MAVNLDSTKIDPHDPQFATMLQNLQGNILKGHGRDHTAHLFLEFTGSMAALRANFGALAARVVISALQQRDQIDTFKASGTPGGPFGNVFLTATGYKKLGFTQAQIDAAFPETEGTFGEQTSFKAGMQAHGDELNDPDPSTWEPGFTSGTIDAMILLADDDRATLTTLVTSVTGDAGAFASVLTVEQGDALRNANGDGIEHFGYLDGRSQPIYFVTDLENEGPTDKWDPTEPLKRVLVPDKTTNAPDSFGSYLVFRKLEQNVKGFKTQEQNLANALGLTGNDRVRAGAMAVGRFEDGTPLALSNVPGFTPAAANNFEFDVDPQGLKCPFHAHIRKTNPRGDIPRNLAHGASEESVERLRRITRRGIPFGVRNTLPGQEQSLDDLPTGGVGLLFMCFQASISNQFAFMQRSWANTPDFVLPGTGPDPVIGQTVGAQNWHPIYGAATPTVSFSFGQFVTLKGGEFFFAPSLPFFKNLLTS